MAGFDSGGRPVSWCDSPTSNTMRQAMLSSQAGQREYLIKHRLVKKEKEYVDIERFRWEELLYSLCLTFFLFWNTAACINVAPLSVSLGFSLEHGTWTASLQTAASSHGSAVTQNLLIFMLWGQWELTLSCVDHEPLYIFLWLAFRLPQILTCFMTPVFKNWTWALKRSFTWTRPRSSCGWKLWRGACTQKPNTRGWVEREKLNAPPPPPFFEVACCGLCKHSHLPMNASC